MTRVRSFVRSVSSRRVCLSGTSCSRRSSGSRRAKRRAKSSGRRRTSRRSCRRRKFRIRCRVRSVGVTPRSTVCCTEKKRRETDIERKTNMESVIFQCDFCGTKSEEESAVWRRPHCSVEIVLRGHRFSPLAGSHTLYGVPFSAPDIEDSRWAATLCDRCMKRISALLGLNLETAEEARWRQEELARTVAAQAARVNMPDSGMRGVMTDQFPTPNVPHVSARSAPYAPVAVVQYPTPRSTKAGKDDPASDGEENGDGSHDVSDDEPVVVPPGTGVIAKPGIAGKKVVEKNDE